MSRNKKPQKQKRNQHTVNRAYLERFADDKRVRVFDKVTKKDFRKSPDALTRRDYFYDTDDSSDQHIEEWFAKTIEPRLMSDLRFLDDAARRVLGSSTAGKDDPNLGALGVPADIRRSLAYAMILQELRTTIARSDMMQAVHTSLTKIGRLVAFAERGQDPGPLKLNYGEYFEAQEHASLFLDPEWIDVANVVMSYPMALLLCGPGRNFYTSDNPVILYHPNPDESPGWLVPGVEILFPISPRMILTFCNTPRFRMADDCLLCVDENFVEFINTQQTARANRDVYSASPNWDTARSTLEMFPELSREDRPRTRVEVPDWFNDHKEA